MEKRDLYQFGRMVYCLRWWIVLTWFVLLLSCVPILPHVMSQFKATGFLDPQSQSAQANTLMNDKLGYSYNRFVIVYSDKTWKADNANFIQEMRDSLAGIDKMKIDYRIITPEMNKKQISSDKHTAYAVLLFKGGQEVDSHFVTKLKNAIQPPPHLSMSIGGEPVFLDDTKQQTQIDLYRAEYIATPVAIITMLLVFGSAVAASLPIILGGMVAVFTLSALYFFGHLFSLSVFTINIALLLGLALCLDYTLFIISRFRSELAATNDIVKALTITQATAGKSVLFSGLAVVISLSALLFFPIDILFSVGLGGLIAVGFSLLVTLILLPALLAILKHRINSFALFKFHPDQEKKRSLWIWLAKKVVNFPYLFFTFSMLILLAFVYPVTHIKYGISDFRILPETSISRQAFDTFSEKFGENQLSPILVLVKSSGKHLLTEKNIGYLYDFATRLQDDPRVKEISSIVNTDPRLSKTQYQMLYTKGKATLPDEMKKFLKTTTNSNLTVITIISKYNNQDEKTKALIKKIRGMSLKHGLSVQVTGTTANTLDVLQGIKHIFPYAFIWIMVFTYCILLVLLRSVILPLKAILTTLLSLLASYGMLVLVIQQGFGHHLLHFEPQGMIDISLLIIIFCALFGVSMDYEVFLLTRIRECYDQTHNTMQSIIYGIDKSCKIITSAAIVMILICVAFITADVLVVKAFGLGIAVAIFIDAFLIRTILVPATMAILKSWNWYLPKCLAKLVAKPNIYPHD